MGPKDYLIKNKLATDEKLNRICDIFAIPISGKSRDQKIRDLKWINLKLLEKAIKENENK